MYNIQPWIRSSTLSKNLGSVSGYLQVSPLNWFCGCYGLSVCVHVCIIHLCLWVCVSMHGKTLNLEKCISYLALWLSAVIFFFFEIDHGACYFGQAICPTNSQDLFLPPTSLSLQELIAMPGLTWVLGIRIQVLMFVQLLPVVSSYSLPPPPVICLMCYLPNPITVFLSS